MRKRLSFFTAIALLMATVAAGQLNEIIVHLDSSAGTRPLQGRLYVFSVTDTTRNVQDPDPFNPTPTFYADVKDWRGGDTRSVTAQSPAMPVKLDSLKPGFYKFAAVFDIDTKERNNTTTPGNWYSRDVVAEVKAGSPTTVHLYLRRQIPARPFKENDSLKLVSITSKLVTDYRKQESTIKAAVVLPASYRSDTTRTYPVVFVIPGWGGTHYDVQGPMPRKRYGMGMGKEKIYVYLNPEASTPFGLHAFIDSKVNGPWGKALVEELVPYLQQHYRISTNRQQHFLVGQSSGGYGVLWLQLHYPDAFGGCWAISSDPVDFREFTSVNIYAKKANMYYNDSGKLRPFFLMNGQYLGVIKNYAQFEDFMGTGGQMQSFEAAFGVLGKDGLPKPLFNRNTGAIDPQVAKAWKAYDLSEFIGKNYKRLATKLDHKIHVYAGAEDNFFLDRPVKLLQERVNAMKIPVTAELIPGANHWSIWSDAFTKRVQSEIDARIK